MIKIPFQGKFLFETPFYKAKDILNHIEVWVVRRWKDCFHSFEQEQVLHHQCVIHCRIVQNDSDLLSTEIVFQTQNRLKFKSEDEQGTQVSFDKLHRDHFLRADQHEDVSGLELELRFEASRTSHVLPAFAFERLLRQRSDIEEQQLFFSIVVMVDEVDQEVDSSDFLFFVVPCKPLAPQLFQIQHLYQSREGGQTQAFRRMRYPELVVKNLQ